MHALRTLIVCLVVVSALMAVSPRALAQDLYDTTVLRTLALDFHDANWLALLRSNYASETNILADLTVDGVTYSDVGVRIRGNTSYTSLPAGSDKFSLKLTMDFVDPAQDIMGYDNLNLNNGFHDPTFSREVVYNNYVAQFLPNPRANHVVVTLNGQNWGVYINVQQPDKTMFRDYFTNPQGLRIGCSNNPNGPGLAYNGPNASGYSAYQVLDDGGLADPIGALIGVANSLSNEPLATWQNIDTHFAIDPSIWSVVLENELTDDDSYVNKGCDFMTYRDPVDARMHLLQRDANETFTQTTWSVTRNFTSTNKPVLNRVLAVPELRQRYMAHYRTVREDMNWAHFGPLFDAQRSLIDAAVQADPKKLYSYTLFQNNFSSTVTLPYSGPAGGTLVGVQQFVTERATFLDSHAELVASGPAIASVQASSAAPAATEAVFITATVAAAGSAVAKVELFYRPSPDVVYARVTMRDDGASGDGAAGDGLYGALLPVTATSGQRVAYYVAATSANTSQSLSFLPVLAERGPRYVEYAVGATDGMRITEWMYGGVSGEFVEFTNMTSAPIDMSGWSFDDDHAVPGAFALGAFGVVQPGESVVLTDAVEATFRAAWSLDATVKVIGGLGLASGNNLGRNDQLHLFDVIGEHQDRLYYGDQTYAGSIRTQTDSGQAPCAALGQNTIAAWQLSANGDGYGSRSASSGERGTPGSYIVSSCVSAEAIFVDGFD